MRATDTGIASMLTVVAMALTAWWLLGQRRLRPLAWYAVGSPVVVLASGQVTAAATASSAPIMGLLERVTNLAFIHGWPSPRSSWHAARRRPGPRNRDPDRAAGAVRGRLPPTFLVAGMPVTKRIR